MVVKAVICELSKSFLTTKLFAKSLFFGFIYQWLVATNWFDSKSTEGLIGLDKAKLFRRFGYLVEIVAPKYAVTGRISGNVAMGDAIAHHCIPVSGTVPCERIHNRLGRWQ